MILLRMSGTHLGQSESVSAGPAEFQASGFSQLFKSGLSDHFGVNDALRLMELNLLKKNQAALAPTAIAFSTCLIGLVKVRSPEIDWDTRCEGSIEGPAVRVKLH